MSLSESRSTSIQSRLKLDTLNRVTSARFPNRVGIVITGFDCSYYGQMIESASNYLRAKGFRVMVQSNQRSRCGDLSAWFSQLDMHCNALIVHSNSATVAELDALLRHNPMAVVLNRFVPSFPERCVFVDNVEAGRIAARCLIDNGHEQIAMVEGPKNIIEVRDRSKGFIEELERIGCELTITVQGDFHQKSGEKAMELISRSSEKVTAVFFQNDEMAFGALNTCRRIGIKVPDDLSILGFDGLPMCEHVLPRLTTVWKPLQQLGEHAAQLVYELLAGVSKPDRTNANIYSAVLAERESISPPAEHTVQYLSLSAREKECLLWAAVGKTSWEISGILRIAESTVNFHLRNATLKLKASNKTHAVAKALSKGLIALPN